MWTMVYFRTLTIPIDEVDDDYSDFIFKFANTFTENSILQGYIKEQKNENKAVSYEMMAELGYSDKDILNMNLDR